MSQELNLSNNPEWDQRLLIEKSHIYPFLLPDVDEINIEHKIHILNIEFQHEAHKVCNQEQK